MPRCQPRGHDFPPLIVHRLLAGDDAGTRILQRVLEVAPAYSLLVEGRPPLPQAASEMLAALRPGRSHADKFVLQFCDEGGAIGCADVIRGHPQDHVAFIGLLLFAESAQGKARGSDALRDIEALSASWRCTRVRIAVVEHMLRELAFWQREGSVEVLRKREPGFTGQAIIVERALRAPTRLRP